MKVVSPIACSFTTFGVAMLTSTPHMAPKKLDIDTITDPSLKRDGESYYAKLDYRYRLKPTSFVQPAVVYLKHQADGKAASYDSLGAEVSWFNLFAKHRLVLTAGYKVQDYQAASQRFGKTREDQQLSLFLAYEYAQLFSSPIGLSLLWLGTTKPTPISSFTSRVITYFLLA